MAANSHQQPFSTTTSLQPLSRIICGLPKLYNNSDNTMLPDFLPKTNVNKKTTEAIDLEISCAKIHRHAIMKRLPLLHSHSYKYRLSYEKWQ